MSAFLLVLFACLPAYSQSLIPQEFWIQSPGYNFWWDTTSGCWLNSKKISLIWSECSQYINLNFINLDSNVEKNLICTIPNLSSLFKALYAFITSLFGMIAISKILKAIFNES